MKYQIVTVGEVKKPFIKDGVSEYLKRLGGVSQVEHIVIKDNDKAYDKIAKSIEKTFVVALDEHGKQYTSRELATFLDNKEQQGIGTISLVIGPADGHNQDFLQKVDGTIGLSKLTLPHELALLFTVEALYRAISINNNHPYHRD